MVNPRLTGLTILGLFFIASCARTTPESSGDASGVAPEARAAKVSETAGDSTQTVVESVVAEHPVAHDEHSGVQQSTDEAHGHRHGAHGHSAPKTTVRHPDAIEIGEKVPDFEVTIAGQTRKLSELQKDTAITADGTISLTFWCSFCHSCRDVEHDLDQLATRYKGKVGVIAVDASFGETTAHVAEFALKEGLTLPIALNESGNVADIFGVATTTTTVVIDSDGVLRYRGQFGNKSHAYAADAIDAVLTGKQMPVKETEHRG